jgi:uncharacterized protein (TIGR00251 family)
VSDDAGRDWCRWDGADLLLVVRVIPGARRAGVAGIRHGRLIVRVETPPEDGRANAAVERTLARLCGVTRGAVAIESGERGRDKRVRVRAPGTLPGALLDP